MSKCYKTVAPLDIELKQVQYMNTGDYADVFLRKNISTETVEMTVDGETQNCERNIADEIYFRVDPKSVTEEDILSNFDKYWMYAEQWTDESNTTNEEIILKLKHENAEQKQCIVEISALI